MGILTKLLDKIIDDIKEDRIKRDPQLKKLKKDLVTRGKKLDDLISKYNAKYHLKEKND